MLVTGGDSGIGFQLALAFVQNGSTVLITGRSESKLQTACQKLGKAEYRVCDVTDQRQIKTLAEEHGKIINVLVNNAGILQETDYSEGGASLEQQLGEIDIDFSGPVRMAHFFLPFLLKHPSAAIVNVGYVLAFVPLALTPIYCATKAAMHSWSRSLRYQLKNSSVKVFELIRPLVRTEIVEDYQEFPMMEPEQLVTKFMAAFSKNKHEITPGQASQMKLMSRIAPGFILNALNKQVGKK